MSQSSTKRANTTVGFAEPSQKWSSSSFDGIPDAETIDPHATLGQEVTKDLNEYIGIINTWQSRDPDFIGNAVRVDEANARRLELMRSLSSHAVLDHPRLEKMRPYVLADRAAIANPDPSEEAYERFMERRENLRDTLRLPSLRISAKEYSELTLNIQGAIANEAHIGMQRDFIAIRKEVAQENAHHPRFVAEVATGPGSLFDEMLVDLDRGDLRKEGDFTNGVWRDDSKVRATLFSEAIAEREKLKDGNGAQRVKAFSSMIEMGKQVSLDPLAIKEFAEIQMTKVGNARAAEMGGNPLGDSPEMAEAIAKGWRHLGGKDYEIGMAALENKKFSQEMRLSFFESIGFGKDLDPKERRDIFGPDTMFANEDPKSLLGALNGRTKGDKATPAASAITKVARDNALLFRAAHAAFRQQFDNGDPRAGLSFSVMEHAAAQLVNDPQKITEIASADMDAAMALEQFNPVVRKAIAEKEGGNAFEEKVHDRLKTEGKLNTSSEGLVNLQGTQITQKGEIDIEDALKPKSTNLMAFPDGKGGLRLAVSKDAVDVGDFVSFKGPFMGTNKETGEPEEMNFGQKGDPRAATNIYATFGEDGKIRLAQSKDELEAGSFAEMQDAGTNTKDKPDSLRAALARQGPHITVLTGGKVRVAASEADAEDGQGVDFSLYGIKVPQPGQAATKDDSYDAGTEAKHHLNYLLAKYGARGLSLKAVDGRDGEKEVVLRLNNQEDVSHRMLRDGYALPSDCDLLHNSRERAASSASRNGRGLWANGFPEDDGKWRGDSLMPHLTRKDKREKLQSTVARSLAGNPSKAQRIFSDRASQLFAMPLNENWEHPGYFREAMDAVQANPERMKKLYDNNVKLMKELRARKDNLTEPEKAAHDQFTVGAKLIGTALVRVGESIDPATGKKTWKLGVTPMDVSKDTDTLLSKRGLHISEGLKKFTEGAIDRAGKAIETAGKKSKDFFSYILNTADQFT